MKRQRRANIRYGENKSIEMFYPIYKGVEFVYNTETHVMKLNEHIIAKHPMFPNIQRFEGWCNVYFVEKDVKASLGI